MAFDLLGRFPLRIGLIPFAAGLLVLALTLMLGNWQLERAQGKEMLHERVQSAERAQPQHLTAADFDAGEVSGYLNRPVQISGRWVPGSAIYLDNRVQDGRVGRYVLMGLQPLESEKIVLVNRGWMPRHTSDPLKIAAYDTPLGAVTIEGMALAGESRLMELSRMEPGKLGGLWHNLDLERYAQVSGLVSVGFIVRQFASPTLQEDGLLRNWPESGQEYAQQIAKHHGYAFQWFALAASVLLLMLYFEIRKRRDPGR